MKSEIYEIVIITDGHSALPQKGGGTTWNPEWGKVQFNSSFSIDQQPKSNIFQSVSVKKHEIKIVMKT